MPGTLLLLVLVAPTLAEPWADPRVAWGAQLLRSEGMDAFLGDGLWDPWALAAKTRPMVEEWRTPADPRYFAAARVLEGVLGPELLAQTQASDEVEWAVRPVARASAGNGQVFNLGGDTEEGSLNGRGRGEIQAFWKRAVLLASVEGTLDMEGVFPVPGVALPAAWAGWRGDHLLAGFGRWDRWLGPGRQGSLLLSNNATPLPMGTVAGEGHLPGRAAAAGRFRFETSVGWFDRPREDVDHPGLLLMDARWMPVPQVEIGATRMAIFWGEGRPWPGILPLLVPVEPHVYDDPDELLPDQNEEASLDLRVTLPLARWVGGPVRYVEGWWQYAGEDVIARELGGLKYPSLAGVANLYGAEASVGAVVATVEFSRILDDYYRWYIEHRIYHDGFTQDGRVLGHEAGTDAESLYGRLAWYPWPWGAEIWAEKVHRVGVVEALEENLFALATDEHRTRVGARGLRLDATGATWSLGYTLERVRGVDFVPDTDETTHLVSFSYSGAPWSTRSLEDTR